MRDGTTKALEASIRSRPVILDASRAAKRRLGSRNPALGGGPLQGDSGLLRDAVPPVSCLCRVH